MNIGAIQIVVLMILCSMAAHDNFGQLLDRKISIRISDVAFEEALKKIEKATNVTFFYSVDQLNIDNNVSIAVEGETLRSILDKLFLPHQIHYIVYEKELAIILKRSLRQSEKDYMGDVSIAKGSAKARREISGTLTDLKTQQVLPGVNILVRGATYGATTDRTGKYILQAEDGDVLMFSFIGYKSQEISVGARSIIDVALEEDVASLNEVVVNAGYWKVSEKEETGNISRITDKEIQKQPVNNPLAAMIGRMPGVYVQQYSGMPGGAFAIQIRGQNSLRNNGNDPLYIIDGVPFTSTSMHNSITLGANGSTNPLNSINPNDIESIEILKDGDATAIYGSRGANGVVLITTKKGKAGKTQVDVNVYEGLGKITRMMKLLNTAQYLTMRHEAFKNDSGTPQPYDYDLMQWDTTRYTDWQKKLIGGTAHTTNAQVSVSGGSANTQFIAGGGFYRETTVFPGDFSYQKASWHVNLNHVSKNNKFRISVTSLYTFEKNQLLQNDLTYLTTTLVPDAPKIFNSDGSLNWEKSTWTNPYGELRKKYKGLTQNFIANALLSYEIIPGLRIKSNLGYNAIGMNETSLQPISSGDPLYTTTGSARFGVSDEKKWIVEPQLDFQRNILKGKLSTLIGSTFQETIRNGLGIYGVNYTNDAQLENIAAAGKILVSSDTYSQYKYNALFGRVNYNWKEKYIFNITGRRDGSSRFGPGNQFSNFGAIGAGWIFSNEKFFQRYGVLSFGKLRGSYGVTGSDQIDDYGYLSTYSSTTYQYNTQPGIVPTRLANPNYGWETNKKLEFGLEGGSLNGHINFSFSYYRNRSSNQLVGYSLPVFTGFSMVQSNLPAKVENKGFEIVLSTQNIKTNKFSWSTSLNFTLPSNRLVSYPNIEGSTYANTYAIGKSLGVVKSYHFLRIDKQTGFDQFQDVDKDGAISGPDRLFMKTISKKYFGGLNNTLKFNGWQLDIFLQYVKQTGYNYLTFFQGLPGTSSGNQPTIVMKRWRKPGDIANIEPFTQSNEDIADGFYNRATSDNAISDASFIRLKNVALSYQLPATWLTKMKMQTARIYFQGQNLLTVTNYLGRDPENQVATALPPLRVLSMGVQGSF